MERVKRLANILFYISRFCAFVYAFLTIYSAVSLLTGWSVNIKGVYFSIHFPFTQITIFMGEHNISYILFNFLMVLVLYSIFFWLLSNVFSVFTQPRLFTKKSIKHLQYFYLANLLIPITATLISFVFASVDWAVVLLIMLHFTLGVFAYFLAEIFNQGVNLQNEQDLFI